MALENLQNYLVPSTGTTQGHRVTKTFVAGVPHLVDFRNYSIDGRSFAPSGVIIDNTQGTGDIVVLVREFEYRIICPAGASIQVPYPAPLAQSVEITGEGKATLIFVNYPVIPLLPVSSGGSPTPGPGPDPEPTPTPTKRTKMFAFEYEMKSGGVAGLTAGQKAVLPTIRTFDTVGVVTTPGNANTQNITIPEGVTDLQITLSYAAVTALGTTSTQPKCAFTLYSPPDLAVYQTVTFPEVQGVASSGWVQHQFIATGLTAGTVIQVMANIDQDVEYFFCKVTGLVLGGDILAS